MTIRNTATQTNIMNAQSTAEFYSIYIPHLFGLNAYDISQLFSVYVGQVGRVDINQNESGGLYAFVHLVSWHPNNLAEKFYFDILNEGSAKLYFNSYHPNLHLSMRRMTCPRVPDTFLNIHQLAQMVSDYDERISMLENRIAETTAALVETATEMEPEPVETPQGQVDGVASASKRTKVPLQPLALDERIHVSPTKETDCIANPVPSYYTGRRVNVENTSPTKTCVILNHLFKYAEGRIFEKGTLSLTRRPTMAEFTLSYSSTAQESNHDDTEFLIQIFKDGDWQSSRSVISVSQRKGERRLPCLTATIQNWIHIVLDLPLADVVVRHQDYLDLGIPAPEHLLQEMLLHRHDPYLAKPRNVEIYRRFNTQIFDDVNIVEGDSENESD